MVKPAGGWFFKVDLQVQSWTEGCIKNDSLVVSQLYSELSFQFDDLSSPSKESGIKPSILSFLWPALEFVKEKLVTEIDSV